jgi:hypothetical protein
MLRYLIDAIGALVAFLVALRGILEVVERAIACAGED